jgi:putative transposase
MTIPHRGKTVRETYFVTANCWEKAALLQSDRIASLFIDVLFGYREQGKYLLHEFVIMPNHFHALLTPREVTLERSMQFIKGGFSFRVGKEFGIKREIWQSSFVDRRVRDAEEYSGFRSYIHQNPVKRGLVARPEDWQFSSACPKYSLDLVPQRLKPSQFAAGMQT